MATKGFEYKTASRSLTLSDQYTPPDETLAAFGQNGWELVDVEIVRSRFWSGTFVELWYFKKEVQIP